MECKAAFGDCDFVSFIIRIFYDCNAICPIQTGKIAFDSKQIRDRE